MKDKAIRSPTVRDGRVSQEGLNINRGSDGRIPPPRAPSAPPDKPYRDQAPDRERIIDSDRDRYNR